jgi:hypothetical protein
LNAIKSDNKDEILKLTSSENLDIHISNLRILNQVGDAPYLVKATPYDRDNNDFLAMVISMSEGECSFATPPTHKLEMTWNTTTEEYTEGHACHRLLNNDLGITLLVHAKDGQIKEVTSCSDNYKISKPHSTLIGDINISNKAKINIKEWLKSQESFSKIGSLKHVKENYSLSFQQANSVIESLCSEL